MKIVALTGGIGSGKSTVAKMFRALGVSVYDSDEEAKALLNTSKELRNALISLLGEEAYLGKELNKKYVAAKIFANKELLLKINNIVHPAVRTHFLKWAEKQDAPYVIQEAAIIFESGNQHYYDAIILVTSPQDVRIERVMNRDDITRDQVVARIRNQWTDEKKIPLSDFIIQNVKIEETTQRVKKISKVLLDNSQDC